MTPVSNTPEEAFQRTCIQRGLENVACQMWLNEGERYMIEDISISKQKKLEEHWKMLQLEHIHGNAYQGCFL